MFSTKLRSWMEAHLVRPRKKQQRKNLVTEQKAEILEDTKKDEGCESIERLDSQLILSEENEPKKGNVMKVTREKIRDERVGGLHNLSSPESAYSTGYSTDGTSPGTSFPPECYINLRTGKHYVAPPPPPLPPPTPRSAAFRSRSSSRARPPLPESSTEEDIAAELHSKPHKPLTPKSQKKLAGGGSIHRRTESYDEGGHRIGGQSPHLGASPRQRNRIRTNPWHPPPTDELRPPPPSHPTDDSSSTLSSSDRPPHRPSIEPPTHTPHGIGRKHDGVTTCSPVGNRPCHHQRQILSSSSSAPSSGSERHPYTSDFTDEEDDDDATLNEMLGKYDESYVYEKETDILSDSDPTDYENDRTHDCNGDSSDISYEPNCGDMDFIDTGSLMENMESDSERRSAYLNKGHCTYHSFNDGTPEGRRRPCVRSSRKGRVNTDGSQGSSRASSRSNRKVKRNLSRKVDDISSSSEFVNKQNSRSKLRQISKEKKYSVDNSPSKRIAQANIDNKQLDPRINLNKVLMERLLNNQRCGTRSADTTPILKRHTPLDYNGKYLRNPHVSKLISSNSALMERRPSLESKLSPLVSPADQKRRSNSIACHSGPPSPRTVDKDGDLKCRQLIREAENILEGFHSRLAKPEYLSPTLSTRSAILPATNRPYLEFRPVNKCLNDEINSQISLLQEKINNNNNPIIKPDSDDGIFKTISKTLERIIVRDPKKGDKSKNSLKTKKKGDELKKDYDSSTSYEINNSHDTPINDIKNNCCRSNSMVCSNGLQFPSPSFRRSSNRFDSCSESRPKLRGVDYIRTTDPNYSPLRMSPLLNHGIKAHLPPDNFSPEIRCRIPKPWPVIPQSQSGSALTTFKSFDLGNQAVWSSRQCPLSEPVKRKVYAGSSTFGKLQKSLMRRESEKITSINRTTENLREENASLKQKVAQLRQERLKVEARVKETQEQIDRLNYAEVSSRC